MPRYSWTQPCCSVCWVERNPGREPVRMNDWSRFLETCVYCGSDTTSGIYVRIDPAVASHPTLEKDA
jgi:hypothetical protein